MTPQEMENLLQEFAVPSRTINKQITARRYNVIVKNRESEIIEIYEMVSLRTAREIKNEAHAEGNLADIIEDWTIDCNDKEINPKPNNSKPAPAPRNGAMGTPQIPEKKANLKSAQRLAKARDNISRSTKHPKCEYYMYRIVNKFLGIDIQDTQEKIAEYLTGRKDIKDFKIMYCGIAESWG